MEALNLHQQQPRPALLLSSYRQLQAEVAAGILDHFYHPQPCTWSGSQYKGPKDAAQVDALPERVRHALILAGCGFPVEQVPADLHQALLASSRTPSDLRAALQATAASSSSNSSGALIASCSSASATNRCDPYISCSAWAEGFQQLCSASVELALPLAMYPRLPVPQQQNFLQYVDQLGCSQLSTIMASHRQYLRQVVQQWPLLGTQGCIAAKDYQPKQWAIQQPVPPSALTVEISVKRKHSAATVPLVLDLPCTAARVTELVSTVLGQRWQELPWLCKGGTAGLVLAGGVVGSLMFKPGGNTAWKNLDLFIIAPDEASYTRVVQDTRTMLDTSLRACDISAGDIDRVAAAKDSADPYMHSWVWEASVHALDTPALMGVAPPTRDRGSSAAALDLSSRDFVVHVKLIWWPFCSPAALVRTCDVPSVAAWFDGEEVFLDERCAWCHANRLLLADPFFDTLSLQKCSGRARFHIRLHTHALRLPGYGVLIPGPLSCADFGRISYGLFMMLKSTKPAASVKQRPGAAAAEAQEAAKTGYRMAMLLKGEATGIGRWALLLAYHKVFGALPKEKPQTNDKFLWSNPNTTVAQQYAAGLLQSSKQQGWHFAGFFLPWGGADAVLGDGNTWYSSGDNLQELPRRVWLAVNGFVDYGASGKTG